MVSVIRNAALTSFNEAYPFVIANLTPKFLS